MNPAHERAVRDRLVAELPEATVCISSDILPEIREYERSSTVAANAYVQPLMSRYLQRFVEGMRANGLQAPLFVMLSEGAIAGPEIVKRVPIRVCESGPAAGAVTASAVAKQLDERRILSFDMGGTTAKTCVVHDGEPSVSTEFEVARTYRFKKGSGFPLRLPVVDLIEIGAGGGSLVQVDELGLLKVGPESAAADPGPACYGRGGVHATVTDADLVLGYIGADSFLGGRMPLDAALARQALAREVGEPLRIGVERAALGVHEIVNENMANAARVQAVERGQDPSGHALVAFGGAGPVHAWGVAQKLGVGRIIVPPSPGVGSAFGLLLAPRALQLARTYIGLLDALDWARVARAFDEMRSEALAALAQVGLAPRQIAFAMRADLRYLGQRKELTVPLPGGDFGTRSARSIREAFETLYERVYHRRHEAHPIEALCWRLHASGPATMALPHPSPRARTRQDPVASAHRHMLFHGWSRHRLCPVYSRYRLAPGTRLAGPAVIEEDESSTLVGPGGRAEVDRFGNLVIHLPHPKARHA
jgi:N-methylhydantoinase A